MKRQQNRINRRQFLRTAGRAALGTIFTATGLHTTAKGEISDEGPDDLD